MTHYTDIKAGHKRRTFNRKDGSGRWPRLRYPDLPTGKFAFRMLGNYDAIIPDTRQQFMVKADTPRNLWRVFYKAPGDLVSTELNFTFPFDLAGEDMWNLLALTACKLDETSN